MGTYKDNRKELLDEFKPIYDYVVKDILTLIGYGQKPIRISSDGGAHIKPKVANKNPYVFMWRPKEGQDLSSFLRCPIDNGTIEFDSDGVFTLKLCENFEDITLTIKNINIMHERTGLKDYNQRLNNGSAEIEMTITDLENPKEFVDAEPTTKDGKLHYGDVFNDRVKPGKYSKATIKIDRRRGMSISITDKDDYEVRRFFKYKINNGVIVSYEEFGNEGTIPITFNRSGNNHISQKMGPKESDGILHTPIQEQLLDFYESAFISNTRVGTTIRIGVSKVDKAINGLNQILASLSPTYHYIAAFNHTSRPFMIPHPSDYHKGIVSSIIDGAALTSCNTKGEAQAEIQKGIIQCKIPF